MKNNKIKKLKKQCSKLKLKIIEEALDNASLKQNIKENKQNNVKTPAYEIKIGKHTIKYPYPVELY